MGYYVSIIGVDFVIPTGNLEESYKALCELNNDNSKKSGGKFNTKDEIVNNDKPNENVWFAWMHWNYPETCKDTQAILTELGFECSLDDEGLSIESYHSKSGSEEVFLNALGPYAKDGSYIFWEGEDSLRWRNMFIDGNMVTYESKKVVYGDFSMFWLDKQEEILKPIGYLAADIIHDTLERIETFEKNGSKKLTDAIILKELVWLVRRIGYPKIWDQLLAKDIKRLTDKFEEYENLYNTMGDEDSVKMELASELKSCKIIAKRWESKR